MDFYKNTKINYYYFDILLKSPIDQLIIHQTSIFLLSFSILLKNTKNIFSLTQTKFIVVKNGTAYQKIQSIFIFIRAFMVCLMLR